MLGNGTKTVRLVVYIDERRRCYVPGHHHREENQMTKPLLVFIGLLAVVTVSLLVPQPLSAVLSVLIGATIGFMWEEYP